jgi:hypothetical protein
MQTTKPTARIIDPQSKFFGLIVDVVSAQWNFQGQVSTYLVKGATTGELELGPWDLQFFYKKPRKGGGVSTQLEMFQAEYW